VVAAPESRDGSFAAGPLRLADAALFTDCYELTMAASYWRERMNAAATFSLFVRRLPPGRAFLVAAGLEPVLDFLAGFRFTRSAIERLRALERFDAEFLDRLTALRFTGEVRAVPEGTVVFAGEPLLEVRAPIAEAQLVEGAVLNLCHLQTLQASKAARCVLAAGGRPVVDFGMRRSQGLDAALQAARAGYIAGIAATSDVLAAVTSGIPTSGTMAHSYVSAFREEIDAFRAFARAFPDHTTLLLDTYDTVTATHRAVRVARELAAAGHRLAAVRLDSGDLAALAHQVRRIFDDAGLPGVRIVASGNLDEHAMAALLAAGAPIDVFGVGTRMNVSADAPYLDMAYKLVEYDGRPVLKTSPGKTTWAGPKQVFRRIEGGRLCGDVVGLASEAAPPGSDPLLATVMLDGALVRPHPPLAAVRSHCAAQLAALPDAARRLTGGTAVPVTHSVTLMALQRQLTENVAGMHPPGSPVSERS
jgi:nicotinate phosphoribosyltransferase